jgi:tRNA 2-thiouridine synthesizing protein A
VSARIVVDSRGRRCPQPVIDLARAAARAAPGTELEVLATDPAARHDVPAWCRLRGHELLEVIEAGGAPRTWRIAVRLCPPPA